MFLRMLWKLKLWFYCVLLKIGFPKSYHEGKTEAQNFDYIITAHNNATLLLTNVSELIYLIVLVDSINIFVL